MKPLAPVPAAVPDPFPEILARLKALGRDDKAPVAIESAEWQSGVTPDNERFRVTLNNEPLVGACAASPSRGWADFIDPAGTRQHLRGRVRVVAGDR